MKKTFLLSCMALACSLVSLAQDRSSFKAGLIAGLPVGDAEEVSSFAIGLDVAYHWGVSELLDVGLGTGLIHAFGETREFSEGPISVTTEFEDFQFVPMAASVRIYPTYHFKLGGDVGYAVGVSEESEGGLYYRPLVGYNITGNTELNVSYVAVDNDGATFSIAMVGLLFLF